MHPHAHIADCQEVVAAKAAVIQHQNALLNDRDAKLRVLQSEMNDLVFSLQSRLQGDQQVVVCTGGLQSMLFSPHGMASVVVMKFPYLVVATRKFKPKFNFRVKLQSEPPGADCASRRDLSLQAQIAPPGDCHPRRLQRLADLIARKMAEEVEHWHIM